jgi:voltage-gated potassium channel
MITKQAAQERVAHHWVAQFGRQGPYWRITRRTLIILGFVLVILVESFLFYWFEGGANSELVHPLNATWYILVFLISGADVPIVSVGGRYLAALFILEGVVATSVLTAAITTFRLTRNRRLDLTHLRGHTVVCGWNPRVRRIIQQFRESKFYQGRTIVLLADLPQDPLPHKKDVLFVQGDPSDDEDLLRAGIRQAASAIVMAELEHEDSDGRAILRTLAIKSVNPDVYTCVEVYDPDNIRHLQRAKADEIVCLNQFGEYLVLQSGISPGLSKLFMEMLCFGVGDEVFRVPLAEWMPGKTFREVMLTLASQSEIVAVAAERDGEIVVNPKGDYRFEAGDHLFVIAPEPPVL